MIGNLYEVTIGVTAQLSFTRNTAIDQVGTISKWSTIAYNYLLMFSTLSGIWAYYGAQGSWISENVGGFYQQLVLASTSFSVAFTFIQQLPCILWNIAWTNNSGQTERTILALDATSIGGGALRWFRFIPQTSGGATIPIAWITSGLDQVNKAQKAWGFDTSGNLYQLFNNAGVAVTSVLNTKLWNFGTRIRWKEVIRGGALVVGSTNASYSVTAVDQGLATYGPILQSLPPTNLVSWVYNNGSPATWAYSGGGAATWFKNQPLQQQLEWDLPLQAQNLGFNFSMTGINCYLYAFGVEHSETPADWGN
jgi:hypothetical protein